jgi:hypothetical protein
MQNYPSISKDYIQSLDYYIFDKLDGSNIRVEFSLKSGFNKFGTRHKLMSDDSGILNQSKDLILAYEEQVHNIFRKNKWQTGTLFFEFYGPQSFAGFHEENDDFKVYLIDSHIGKIGFLHPKDYLKAFEDSIEMAQFLKIGKFNKPFLEEVKNGQLEGMTFEGVIGKSSNRNKLIRCKAKSQAWLSRLKDKCGDDEQLFEKLA